MNVLERIKNGELTIYTAIKKVGYVPVATNDSKELIELAERGARMQWVDVEKRIPDHEQKVDIFLIDGGRVSNVTFIDDGTEYCTGDRYFCDNDFDVVYDIEEVSHWMMIPADPTD